MMRRACRLFMGITLLACRLSAAQPASAADVARDMLAARASSGFTLRLLIRSVDARGQLVAPMRLALTGQNRADLERLLVHEVASSARPGYAVQKSANGPLRSVRLDATLAPAAKDIDPQTRLFDSALVLWDMLTPWWNWPQQRSEAGTARFAGVDCRWVWSTATVSASPVSKVHSCVDRSHALALKTELYDAHGTLARSIQVQAVMGSTSGRLVARRLSVQTDDQWLSQIEVYSGDEHYAVAPDAFVALDAAPMLRHEGSR